MSNMSYCRFQNTANDLDDCLENISEPCSREEHRARLKLIKLCQAILQQTTYDDDTIMELPIED